MVADNFSSHRRAIEMLQSSQIAGKMKCYHQESVMDILFYVLDIRISFYISSICHSVIYLAFIGWQGPNHC